MKTIKRIIAVVLLIVLALSVCYMVKTCSRLKGADTTIENYQNITYYTEDGEVTLLILDDNTAKYTVNGDEIELTYKEFSDGVIDFITEEKAYSFVVLDDNSLFDANTNEILKRSKYYEEENSV